MELNGWALPIALGVIATVLFVLIVTGRPACRRPVTRMAARGGLTALFTTVVLALVGALFNNEYAFYTSWGDLLGAPSMEMTHHYGAPAVTAVAATTERASTPTDLPPLPSPSHRLQRYEIPGPARPDGSRAQRAVFVHLPLGYDPAKAQEYPVIVAMHGQPGTPRSYNHLGGFYAKLDAAAKAGVVRDAIVVVPALNSSADGDGECIDAPGGEQEETWLARDLPTWVRTHFRAASGRSSWTTWGYSFGGWCASMVAMKHPDVYGAAVSFQGYYSPQFPGRSLLVRGSALARSYDLAALERTAPPPVALWIFASEADPESYPSTKAFLASVKAPTSVTAHVGKGGGHRLSVWTRRIPTTFQWLAQSESGFAPLTKSAGTSSERGDDTTAAGATRTPALAH